MNKKIALIMGLLVIVLLIVALLIPQKEKVYEEDLLGIDYSTKDNITDKLSSTGERNSRKLGYHTGTNWEAGLRTGINDVLSRAQEVLTYYEKKSKNKGNRDLSEQVSFNFDTVQDNKLLDRVKDIDPLNTTPMEAINILYELKELSKK